MSSLDGLTCYVATDLRPNLDASCPSRELANRARNERTASATVERCHTKAPMQAAPIQIAPLLLAVVSSHGREKRGSTPVGLAPATFAGLLNTG